MARLFTYGTLQLPEVQQANFGRLLTGAADVLLGYAVDSITIHDPTVVALSGETAHKILRESDAGDAVSGMVFELTDAELAAADDYETDEYRRVAVLLESGTEAFVYVAHP